MEKKSRKLPETTAKTAEKRLEELVKDGSILRYEIVNNGSNYEEHIDKGKGMARLYEDGFEAVSVSSLDTDIYGFLHVNGRGIVVEYYIY